ncbi:hypothetical protein PR003_g4753 [Phytophthora rubi]|uniref:Uncharacterized protein n=1 Tax=Phytophthora rubi TaxID=129364 RepID=A0A6A4FLD1_9STRA|nr:hypothetical protein PR001_g4827 [Phytophthora rubi]KAE9351722.1 hypothetical protein PR003_g4753 [Phytophthora rubi]
MFTKKSKEEFMCLTCWKTCKRAHGYSNLITHLRTNHSTYLKDASKAAKDRNALRLRVVDDETRTIFRWVSEELPPTFGLVLNGSTFNGRHYIAIFAVFNDTDMCHGTEVTEGPDYYDDTDCYTCRFVLLAFCPL